MEKYIRIPEDIEDIWSSGQYGPERAWLHRNGTHRIKWAGGESDKYETSYLDMDEGWIVIDEYDDLAAAMEALP